MMLGIGVEQPPDHALVLGVMFLRLFLKKLDTSLAQGDGYLDPFIPKDKVLGAWEKVRNDPEASEWFVRVLDFRAHRFASPFASNRLQKSESRHGET